MFIYSVISARFVETENVTNISENFDVSSEEETSVRSVSVLTNLAEIKVIYICIGLYIVEFFNSFLTQSYLHPLRELHSNNTF